jgi:phage baseplate assembly protein W
MEGLENDFLGTGWKFPVTFSESSGTVDMLSGEEDIVNSLRVLFETSIGERVMQPDYGSGLETFVFEHVTKGIITYMQSVVSNAILFHEPRIILDEVNISVNPLDVARLDIAISYRVSATNNRYNYVFPFYVLEATNLDK